MDKKMINQNGISLVEILATISVLSIIVVLIFGILINGLNTASKAKENALLQQKANYVLAILREEHEKGNCYRISISNDYHEVRIDSSCDNIIDTTINDSQFKFDINGVSPTTPIDIVDKITYISIVIIGKNDSYEINTNLSRL
ncbi:PilW family protein [Ureibacillus endophyticus]|uniref:Type II secretion system protein n=1 Tax=Ureibacillus endophyticus TaxID=1978490 RepID=A0A494Z671_9BACL|nr:type II secretion system protein [Lysinibacillus endophyticus]RKQ18039.1 type II secretion system protein [Lysinibacillus endophyticus]